MEYELGVRLDRIEAGLQYIINKIDGVDSPKEEEEQPKEVKKKKKLFER